MDQALDQAIKIVVESGSVEAVVWIWFYSKVLEAATFVAIAGVLVWGVVHGVKWLNGDD